MKHRDGFLDLIRGVAALLVMLGHLRAFLFIDYADAGVAHPLWKAFYLATGLGHQAVMVFFVLSGYFVGGSVLSAFVQQRFSWQRYAVARLSRLWTVLVPTLILTLALDSLGSRLVGEAYSGLYANVFCSGPSSETPASLGPLTFLGNLFFVQTIEVPVYGSNGPLWSLANEFWYYALFPLLVFAVTPLVRCGMRHKAQGTSHKAADGCGAECAAPVVPRDAAAEAAKGFRKTSGWGRAMISLFLATVLILWLPSRLVSYGLIWLMGAVVWWLAHHSPIGRWGKSKLWRVLPAPLFLASLALSKTDLWFGNDWMVAATFTLWMPGLLGPWPKTGWWSRVSTALSEVSYTLYVVHFPLLFFIAAFALGGHQWLPGPEAILIFTALALGVLLISAGWWWLFEYRTNQVRRWMTRLLSSRQPVS